MLRAEVEHALELQGAVVVQRDDQATTYLGCPQGDGAALTCASPSRDGRRRSRRSTYAGRRRDALAAWRTSARPLRNRPPARRPARPTVRSAPRGLHRDLGLGSARHGRGRAPERRRRPPGRDFGLHCVVLSAGRSGRRGATRGVGEPVLGRRKGLKAMRFPDIRALIRILAESQSA